MLGSRFTLSTRAATAVGTRPLGALSFVRPDTSLWTIRGLPVLLGLGFGRLIGVMQKAASPHQVGVA
ncbi:hypothetical protein ABZS66_49010, partial [Dactylosporangium sp. NPDC005572]|uniref:hypothetical protein n=1 Tax=Dactylosporangium sp. NPDC005572 TaxID=3156889 RepID=UPI0033A2162D